QGIRHVLSGGPAGGRGARLAHAGGANPGERGRAAARPHRRHGLQHPGHPGLHQQRNDARTRGPDPHGNASGGWPADVGRHHRSRGERRGHPPEHRPMKFAGRLDRLPGYPLAELPARKRALIAQGVDVIDLGAGDADYPPPAEVIEAMRQATGETALSKYGFQQGNPVFRKAACDWMGRRFGASSDPQAAGLPLIGSKEGLSHVPRAVLNPGDVAVVPEPGYQAYLGGTVLSGGEPYVYPLTPRTRYLVELEEIPAAVLPRVRLLYLNYPN